MEKIPTLFDRRNGRITPELSKFVMEPTASWVATEKIDGANVRVTVRNGTLVRIEARRNPSRKQKEAGIVEPWYRDVEPLESNTSDRWLWVAAGNVNYQGIPDGEWSAEAVGPKIQGNPLKLEEHTLYFFSLIPWKDSLSATINIPAVYGRIPFDFEELRDWLFLQQSDVNPEVGIEGVVWWLFDDPVAKIKVKDYG